MGGKYCMFIGRWQVIPPHQGHIKLIETKLKEGEDVLIAIRDTEKDEKNPYSVEERFEAITKAFLKWGDKVKIIAIPDIKGVYYGRGVGYEVKQIKLDEETEKISGTQIRKKQNIG